MVTAAACTGIGSINRSTVTHQAYGKRRKKRKEEEAGCAVRCIVQSLHFRIFALCLVAQYVLQSMPIMGSHPSVR